MGRYRKDKYEIKRCRKMHDALYKFLVDENALFQFMEVLNRIGYHSLEEWTRHRFAELFFSFPKPHHNELSDLLFFRRLHVKWNEKVKEMHGKFRKEKS